MNHAAAPPDSPLAPASGADNYAVGPAIARGGMGSILTAEDQRLKRTVAIKVLLLDAHADDTLRRRFLREAEVLAMLAHPNIVPIYDIVWEDGMPLFYAMKLVKGRTLEAILKDLREEDPEVLREYSLDHLLLIFRKVCDALAFAHSKGVLHRDLKPENVMVGEFGEVLVMDWGLAKIMGETLGGATPDDPLANDARILPGQTLAGSVMGTPEYMSPEQAMGHIGELDERSDIYSLGALLYAILTLRPPVEGKSPSEILEKVSRGQIPSPSSYQTGTRSKGKTVRKGDVLEAKMIKPLPHVAGGRVPAPLSSVVMKALQLDKAKRYSRVVDFAADIDSHQGGFATSAQQAGTLKQLQLLMARHKAVTLSMAVLLLISCGFILMVLASERRANASAESALANAQRATTSEAEARQSLAKAQISVAEAAYRRADLAGMVAALEETPADLRDQSWDYFSAKRDSSLGSLTVEGFTDPVDLCAVPGQPRQFALANRQGKIGVIDVVTQKLLRTIDTGDSGNMRFCFSGDGRRLLSLADKAPNARLFDTASGIHITSIPVENDGENTRVRFNTVALNQKGDLAAIVNSTLQQFQVVETATGRVLWQHDGVYVRMEFHPNGRRLLVLKPNQRVFELFDVEHGRLIAELPVYPQSMALSPDGKIIALGLYTGELALVDAMTGHELRRLQLHNYVIDAVAWTAGGHLLTMGGEGGFESSFTTLRLWDPERFTPLGTFFGVTAADSFSVAYMEAKFNAGSGHLLTQQSPPQLWHFPDIPLARMEEVTEQGWSCNFLSDTVLLARSRFELKYYDVSNPREPVPEALAGPEWHAMATVDQASGMFAIGKPVPSGSDPGAPPSTLKLSQFTSEGVVDHWVRPLRDDAMDLAFDAGTQRLLVVTSRNGPPVPVGIQILNVADGTVLKEMDRPVQRAAFAGARGWIVALECYRMGASKTGSRITLIDPADGETRASVTTPNRINALAVSPDRSLVAIAGDDQMVEILDADTLEEKHRFLAHDAAITTLRFHPFLPVIASGSTDHSIKLWDYRTTKLKQTFLGLDGRPVMMSFSPNGKLLATDGMEKSFRLLDIGDLTE